MINSAPELEIISVTPAGEITIGHSITCSATATYKKMTTLIFAHEDFSANTVRYNSFLCKGLAG